MLSAYCSPPTVLWCPRRDSNPEPTDYESAALTVELQGHTKKGFAGEHYTALSVSILLWQDLRVKWPLAFGSVRSLGSVHSLEEPVQYVHAKPKTKVG
jgi:hypothetical protein